MDPDGADCLQRTTPPAHGLIYDDGSTGSAIREAEQEVRSGWRAIRGSFGSGPFVPALVSRTQLFMAARVAVSAGVAWALALAVDPNSRPYLAPLAVLLIVQPTVYDSLSRAFQRIVGVVLGVAAALAVSHFFAPSGWTIGIIMFAGLLIGWTVRLGPAGVVQVPVSALLVFAVGSAVPDYGGQRVVETLIGSAVAVLAVLASPSAPARRTRGFRCGGTVASMSRPPHGNRVVHQLAMDPPTDRGLAERGAWTGPGRRSREADPRGASAHCPLECTGPWTTPRARRGRTRRCASAHSWPLRHGRSPGLWSTARPMLLRCTPSAPCSCPPPHQLRPTRAGSRRPASRRTGSDSPMRFVMRARRSARRWHGPSCDGADDPTQWLTFGPHPGHEPPDSRRGRQPARVVGRIGLRFA